MNGYLCLQDGTTFKGKASESFNKPIQGEIVFFTGMTGYQEVLTDPSYKGQIVVFTYPLIGNYGINQTDGESDEIQVSGVIMFQCEENPSHFQSCQSLGDYLNENHVPFLTGVDTREVTKAIRAEGTQQAAISTKPDYIFQTADSHQIDKVKGESITTYGEEGEMHVALIDFGWKRSILNALLEHNLRVSVVPFSELETLDQLEPDAVVLSNGPGDPKDTTDSLPFIKNVLDKYPSFGICMGHQVIALAYGADTTKLTFGHRGANHPVKDVITGKVFLSSQNHNYVVKEESLENTPLVKRFYNVNDGSVEGLMHDSKLILSAQFHPEAHPGPKDAEWLFHDFIKLVKKKGVKAHVS
ncbi:carbamoyl phosphate synthase small subunit [Halobacillus karajensis]|uniref:Carbamoyl phosphate synthase small chain n=1 Tax=Halobacillus karajensis TaxID=195088 RepID=A0A059NVF2_9BACI|nr:carbamoyl phosphate synthase small subunit [Halobacillus karajensis]CDQ18639.1 Carbamoyl-phosphate synthase arginine-specific small chain [Halobacillus karajensis]CDQ23289.1 Carbamoyl-phosphate synthase arginine-specific small chain [Halobacillus karajensis]CDQ26771.1 Carbamoyl-phosphate synthase arginine-specific small chain [Halobacillus karajensis]